MLRLLVWILLLSFLYGYYAEEAEIQKRRVRKNEVKKPAPPACTEISRLETLSRAFQRNPEAHWHLLLEIGDIYRKGAFPRYVPDVPAAMACYRCAAQGSDKRVASEAQMRCAEVFAHPMALEDRSMGQALPASFAEAACRIARVMERPKVPPPAPARIVREPAVRIASDAQNVHDHAVIQATKKNLDTLGEAQGDVRDAVRSALLESPTIDADDVLDALTVLDTLGDTAHSTLGVSELGALNRVWARVKGNPDHVAVLGKQLASAVEHGHVVCSTGKIARMTSTLDGLDDTVERTRPLWAVKEELGTLAARIRDSKPATLQRDAFESEALKTYVHDLKFNETIIRPMIELYLEGFD